MRFNTPGTPDVLVVLPPAGRLVGIELKSPAGRISPAQRAVHETLRAAGAVALVVRSIEDLEAGLREAGWGK